MYERLLDKQTQPTLEAFYAHCGDAAPLLRELDAFLTELLGAPALLRFPYGNHYGWGLKYSRKKAHFCDVFAERGAFTIMVRLSNPQFESVYGTLKPYTQTFVDNKYPCGNGGYIHYRVLLPEHLEDAKALLAAKLKR